MKSKAQIQDLISKYQRLQERMVAVAERGDGVKVSAEDLTRVIFFSNASQTSIATLAWVLDLEKGEPPPEGMLSLEEYLFQASQFIDHLNENCVVHARSHKR